jgi:NodT family efflux transporter outer membrane factor (OMF) lipoprotein
MSNFSSAKFFPASRVYCLGLIAVGLVAMIAGCKVGPNYETPKQHMPAAWVSPPTTRASITVQEPLKVENWWTTFNDPELNSLVERAVKSNLSLAIASERIRAARATVCISSAPLLPLFTANGAYTRTNSETNHHALNTDLWHGGFDATWELDVFGGVRRGVESANAAYESTIEDRRDILVSLLGELATDYVRLRGFQQQVKISQENLTAQERTLRLTQDKKAIGTATGLDVANSEAEVAGTRASIATFESTAQQQIYAIAVLLGEEPTALLQELAPVGDIPLAPPVVPVGLPADLLRRRPDIRRAERDLAAATADIGVATADLFPRFGLNGTLTMGGPNFPDVFNWGKHVATFGPTFNWTIFDAGQIWSNIEVKNAQQQQALLNYRLTVLSALADVETSLTAYAQEQQRRAQLADSVAANQRAVSLAQEAFELGQRDFLNVIVAQESLLNAQNLLVQSNQAVATDLVAIYKALGGGWEVGEPTATTQPVRQ